MTIASPNLRQSQWLAKAQRNKIACMEPANYVQNALDVTGMSQADLARQMTAAGVAITPDKLNKVLAGTRRLKADEALMLQSIIRKAPRLNRLERTKAFSFDEAMTELERSEQMGIGGISVKIDSAPQRKAQVTIPEYDVRASAGPGSIVDSENVRDEWAFSRHYLDSLGVLGHKLGVIEVIGDSMADTLNSGDRILVDMTDRNPARPGVFVLWDSDATVVKRVEKIPASDPPVLVLISDNPSHRPYEVNAEFVNIVGRVVWYARRL